MYADDASVDKLIYIHRYKSFLNSISLTIQVKTFCGAGDQSYTKNKYISRNISICILDKRKLSSNGKIKKEEKK